MRCRTSIASPIASTSCCGGARRPISRTGRRARSVAPKETPSQTAGPFVHIGTLPAVAGLKTDHPEHANVLVREGAGGQRIRIEGLIHDGTGALVKDALVEIWQPDANGRYGANDFTGWGRTATDFATGLYWFDTIKPGTTPFHDGRPQAPHIWFS